MAVPNPGPLSLTTSGVHPADWPVLRQLLARENFIFYASEFLRGPPEAPYSGRFFAAPHHETWADLVNAAKRLCVIAARDHGKSFAFTFAYPLWMAEKNPGRDGYIFSASQPQAEKILLHIMREVETNPRLKHLLPGSRSNARWSAKNVELANGFTLYARGYGTKVRGGHPVFIVGDDMLNDETAFSETTRLKEIDYFYNAITNMIVPGGQIIVVGTPFHHQDLYGDLKKNKEYVVREFAAIIDEHLPSRRALWPDRYSLALLDRKRDEIKSLRFAREFMCQAVTDLASLFPTTLFKGNPTEQMNVRLGMPWQWWEEHGIKKRFIGVDFALSTETGLDYTVIFVMGLDAAGNRWVLDIIRDRGMAYGEQLSRIVDAARKYNPQMIFVESNQAQKIFGNELIQTTDLPIRHFVTGSEKHSLEKGLPSLRVLLENRKFRIPRGDEKSIEKTDIWIDEMRSHTVSSGRILSVGEHDDTAMACWICDQAVRGGDFGFSFGEQDGDEAAFDEVMADMLNPDEEEEWDDFIPGAIGRRGRQKQINADIVNGDEIDDSEDNPRNPHGMPKLPGRRPSKQEQDWRPKDGSPTGADIATFATGRVR